MAKWGTPLELASASDPTTGLLVGTDGTVTAMAVDSRVDGRLASSEAVVGAAAAAAEAAVDADLATKDIVLGGDDRIFNKSEMKGTVGGFKNLVGQLVAHVTPEGLWRANKGFMFKRTKLAPARSDKYAFAIASRNRRLSELRIDLRGKIPDAVLNAWGSRADPTYWPFLLDPKLTVKTVKQDGTGDYTSLSAAVAATTTTTLARGVLILLYPGEYTEVNFTLPLNMRVCGIGNPETVWIKGELPASTSDSAMTNTSTFWLKKSAQVANLKVTGKNLRYPIHSEDQGANTDAVHVLLNVIVEHFGNQEAIDYRAANSLPPGSPWLSQRPYGFGSASGVDTTIRDSSLYGVLESFYIHTNRNFARPTKTLIDRCNLVVSGTNVAVVTVQDLGSGTPDELIIRDTFMTPRYLVHHDPNWFTADEAKMYAHADTHITLDRSSPIGYNASSFRKRALKLTSNSTTTGSSIRVSGTAATALFGPTIYRDGGGGIAGYAYGDLDISGILGGTSETTTMTNTLGRRLGDCTTVNKTLTVTIDGGTPVNIVFTANHTADTNTTILGIINGALTGAVASSYNQVDGEYYPQVPDKQGIYYNGSSTVGIPRWAAVKLVGGKLALMGTADPVTVFAGIALEPIPPGKRGRILREGRYRSAQLNGAPTIVSDAAVYFSDTTAGAFSATGTRIAGLGGVDAYATIKGA